MRVPWNMAWASSPADDSRSHVHVFEHAPCCIPLPCPSSRLIAFPIPLTR